MERTINCSTVSFIIQGMPISTNIVSYCKASLLRKAKPLSALICLSSRHPVSAKVCSLMLEKAPESINLTAVLDAEKRRGREVSKMRLPIFYSATRMTSWVITKGPELFAFPRHFSNLRLLYLVATLTVLGAFYAFQANAADNRST